MKTLYSIAWICTLFVFIQCSDAPQWFNEIQDNEAPGPVKDVVVENIPGGAVISFKTPSDKDLLGVKAVYSYTAGGDLLEAFSSAFSDTIRLNGFPDTNERTVQLIAIDLNKNESQPLSATIKPMTPPVEIIRNSLVAHETFGGVFVSWENSSQADIGVSLYVEDTLGYMNLDYTYFTRESKGNYSFRGYANKQRKFRVQIRDRWNNSSSPLDTLLTPLFEENIVARNAGGALLWQRYGYADKTAVYRGDFPGQFSNCEFSRMFDGSIHVNTGYFHPGLIATFNLGVFTGQTGQSTIEPKPLGITIDMVREVKLSRFKIRFRDGANLNQNDPLHLAVWATNEKPKGPEDFGFDRMASLAYWTPWDAVAGTDAWKNDWQHVAEVQIVPPSGATEPYQWTAEDFAWAKAGIDFEFDPTLSNTPFRYLRIVCYENLKHTVLVQFADWEVYGSFVTE